MNTHLQGWTWPGQKWVKFSYENCRSRLQHSASSARQLLLPSTPNCNPSPFHLPPCTSTHETLVPGSLSPSSQNSTDDTGGPLPCPCLPWDEQELGRPPSVPLGSGLCVRWQGPGRRDGPIPRLQDGHTGVPPLHFWLWPQLLGLFTWGISHLLPLPPHSPSLNPVSSSAYPQAPTYPCTQPYLSQPPGPQLTQ